MVARLISVSDDTELSDLHGAAPPESCGGPRGYRLMLKRQQQGASVSDPALVEAMIQLLSATHPEQPASTWNLLRDAVREGWENVDRRLLRARTVGTRSLQPPRSQRAAGNALPAREDSAMKFLVQVICISESAERRQQVFEMERENLTMETLGLSLEESKALLRGVQEFVVAEQVADDLERRRNVRIAANGTRARLKAASR